MRRAVTAVCLLLAIALPCHAQGDKPKPNTLTPREIADGWILLFDGETTFGWQASDSSAAPPTVDQGSMVVRHGLQYGYMKSSTAFRDFELTLEYNVPHQGAFFGFLANDSLDAMKPKVQTMELPTQVDWTPVTLRVKDKKASYEVLPKKDKFFKDRYAKGQFEWSAERSCIVLGHQARNAVAVRNIKLRSLNTTSLFNGKDLTGWREFPGKKSKFAVIDNAINVKDGPGDLQTVGKYKDFILQLDCISNGKHLNSGIFFRCRDNEYQNGYEAQIRNEFKAEPQKYLVEEYDPKTNKLIGKKEVLSNAFDFGTGAIYRRVPARKQMSRDGEWFGMTIVAHGNHLATWVNGVQVTDWYDNRPKTDNARTGCKLDAGHISIQGHDPTTDLSFKNFRIVEFK